MSQPGESFFQNNGRRRSGQIRAVVGKADGRGIPELFEAELSDGLRLQMPTPVGDKVELPTWVFTPVFLDLGSCPICGYAPANTDDHVPPHSIGGRRLVRVCARCNSEFGARFEHVFADWYEMAVPQVRLGSAGVRGERYAGRYLLRETPAGEFVMFSGGGGDSAVGEILGAPGFTMSNLRDYDMSRVSLAAAKSVFLVACALWRAVPDTPRTEQLREELVEAIQKPRNAAVRLGPITASLRVARAASRPVSGQICLMKGPDGGGRTIRSVGLNRYVAIDWPMEDDLFDRLLEGETSQ